MSLKKAYLYLASIIALIVWVIGGIMLLNIALKTWVFTKADRLDYYYYGTCASEARPMLEAEKPAGCSPDEERQQRQEAEDRRSAQKQRDASMALAMIVIAAPVWWGHWRLAKREV